MSRGLPYSLLVHVLALVLITLYGNYVAHNPVRPARRIPVSLVYQQQESSQATVPEQPVEVPDDPVVQPEVARPEVQPESPPKELPEEKPEQVKPREEEEPPVEEIRRPVETTSPAVEPETTPSEAPGETATAAAVSGPAVSETDTDFPFAWYLTRVEGLIARNWNPRQYGFSNRAVVSCAVHFKIARNGVVSGVTLVQPSASSVFDREALGAVQTTRLPPLPGNFRGNSLGVTFIFNLEPGF